MSLRKCEFLAYGTYPHVPVVPRALLIPCTFKSSLQQMLCDVCIFVTASCRLRLRHTTERGGDQSGSLTRDRSRVKTESELCLTSTLLSAKVQEIQVSTEISDWYPDFLNLLALCTGRPNVTSIRACSCSDCFLGL
jgi:hypothetical protein